VGIWDSRSGESALSLRGAVTTGLIANAIEEEYGADCVRV
jgi:hypothetical protein